MNWKERYKRDKTDFDGIMKDITKESEKGRKRTRAQTRKQNDKKVNLFIEFANPSSSFAKKVMMIKVTTRIMVPRNVEERTLFLLPKKRLSLPFQLPQALD